MKSVMGAIPVGALVGVDTSPTASKVARGESRHSETTFHRDAEVATLVQQIFLMHSHDAPKTVVFAAFESKGGCSRIAAGAAAMLAQHSGPVCLLQSNQTSPSKASALSGTEQAGLSDALRSNASIFNFVLPTREENLSVLPFGALGDGTLLLATDRLRQCFAELLQQFRYIMIDAPPLSNQDTRMLSRLADGVVMVLEAGRTRRDSLASTATELRASSINILGIVLNKEEDPIPESLNAFL